MMLGYDYHWRDDDQEWEIQESELKLEIELNQRWTYVAKLDVVADNEEGRWIWDHKTFKTRRPSADYRIIDPQSALYVWAYERIYGIKPAGFVFNYLRTKLPTVPKLLKNGGLSRAKNVDTNWITLSTALKGYGLNPDDYQEELAAARARDSDFYDRVFVPRPIEVIRNVLADIKEKLPRIRAIHEGARPTRTLTRECEHGCDYYLLCLTELTGGDSTYIRKQQFTFKMWEEYDGNEKLIESE